MDKDDELFDIATSECSIINPSKLSSASPPVAFIEKNSSKKEKDN